MTEFAKLISWVRQPSSLSRRRRATFQPAIDALEERNLMAVLFVDDDLAQMPAAGFTSIQAAVTAAAPGDLILVSPGTYEEAVVVPKRLTIQGSFAPASLATNPSLAAIVDVPAGTSVGFNLIANDIVLQGFTIGDLNGDGLDPVGVQTGNSTQGNQIISNVIQQNMIGIYLNSSASATRPTVVAGNDIRNNNVPGPAGGTAIYSDQGLVNATISGNRISGHLNTAINLTGGVAAGAVVQTQITVTGNQLTNDGAIALANTTNSTISANTSRNSSGSGIFLAGGNSNINITGNTLLDGAFTGINLRTNAFGNAPVPNTDIRITGNTIRGFGDSGIRLREGSNHVHVLANTISLNRAAGDVVSGFGGISLESAVNNRIESNTLLQNTNDGIFADLLSVGNLFVGNFALLNGEHDYHDESIGLGTAGTANIWTRNRGFTQNRPGLIN